MMITADGARTTVDKAKRAVAWFNRGRPRTMGVTVTVEKDGKVSDADSAPLLGAGEWRTLELEVFTPGYGDYNGRTVVELHMEGHRTNEGCSGPCIMDVRSVELDRKILRFKGYDHWCNMYDDTYSLKEASVELAVIDLPEIHTKSGPAWIAENQSVLVGNPQWYAPLGISKIHTTRQATLTEWCA